MESPARVGEQRASAAGFERLACHRIVSALVAGLDVLDVGSGDGEGAALLAAEAKSVVGVDELAIRVSAATARHAGLRHKLSFARALPWQLAAPDGSFDLVCCFGVEPKGSALEATLTELARVLRADGMLVLATTELDEAALRAALERHFPALRAFAPSGAQLAELPPARGNGDAHPARAIIAFAGKPDRLAALALPGVESSPPASGAVPVRAAAPEATPARAATSTERLEAVERELAERRAVAELWREVSATAGALQRELVRAAEHAPAPPERATYELIVPTSNNPELTARCIDSLLAHTDPRHPLLLIDDASPDPAMDPLLRSYAERFAHVRYERLAKNVGFPGAVNHGLAQSTHDVVLINSDTEFPPGWLARLERCRNSDPRIGTVSPLSNNATICSVPNLNRKNTLPPGLSLAEMDRLVQATSLRRYPRAPTVVGFCMLITRRMLDAVGTMDPAFGRGYGEEVDLCQRGWAKGFESALCDDLYVYHHGEAGFSHVPEKSALQQANQLLLARRWPQYHGRVHAYCLTNPLRLQQERLKRALAPGDGRPRVLHVTHRYGARSGTELFVQHLVSGLGQRIDSTILLPAELPRTLDVETSRQPGELEDRIVLNTQTAPLEYVVRGMSMNTRSRNAERIFAEVVAGGGFDVVHFSHLANLGSLALPVVARALGARVVLVLHDYFLLCPDWNLAHPDRTACGKVRVDDGPGCASCLAPRFMIAAHARPPDLGALLRERNVACRAALEAAHVLVAPSRHVKETFRQALGDALAERIEVIPHGTSPVTRSRARDAGALTVAFLGFAAKEKGREVFFDAARRLADSPVKLRVIGALAPDSAAPPPNVQVHGPYRQEQLPELLSEVDVVVIASTWHETYCYTLDEAYRAGLPVIASNVGAIAERVRHGVTGLVVPPGDGQALCEAIAQLDRDRALLARLRAGVSEVALESHERQCQRYAPLLAPEEPSAQHQLIRQGMASATRGAAAR